MVIDSGGVWIFSSLRRIPRSKLYIFLSGSFEDEGGSGFLQVCRQGYNMLNLLIARKNLKPGFASRLDLESFPFGTFSPTSPGHFVCF